MWIFNNDSFVSVVQDNKDDTKLWVRSRVKGDIEALFGKDIKVAESETSDYRFRIQTTKEKFADVMRDKILSIDYVNFKKSVKSNARHDVYLDIWSIMYSWQESLYKRSKGWWLEYRNNG